MRLLVQVSTVLGVAIREERLQHSWTEGVAIWVAVIVVSGVGKPNQGLLTATYCLNHKILVAGCTGYQKDKQFRKLNEKKDLLDVKMIRGGAQVLIPNPEIVVGDVIILQTGDKITADGIVIDSNNMIVDEASLTGESEPIKKGPKDIFCRAGTTVSPCTTCLSMHARRQGSMQQTEMQHAMPCATAAISGCRQNFLDLTAHASSHHQHMQAPWPQTRMQHACRFTYIQPECCS